MYSQRPGSRCLSSTVPCHPFEVLDSEVPEFIRITPVHHQPRRHLDGLEVSNPGGSLQRDVDKELVSHAWGGPRNRVRPCSGTRGHHRRRGIGRTIRSLALWYSWFRSILSSSTFGEIPLSVAVSTSTIYPEGVETPLLRGCVSPIAGHLGIVCSCLRDGRPDTSQDVRDARCGRYERYPTSLCRVTDRAGVVLLQHLLEQIVVRLSTAFRTA